MEGNAQAARSSPRAGHAFPAYRMIGSMRALSGGKNDAAIASACEKRLSGNCANVRRASQIEEEESL